MKHLFLVLAVGLCAICAPTPVAALECVGDCDRGRNGGGQNGGNDGGPGGLNKGAAGHRGAGTTLVGAAVKQALFSVTGVMPSGNVIISSQTPRAATPAELAALSIQARRIICMAQSMMGQHDDFASARLYIATMISDHLNVSLEATYLAIRSSGFCNGTTAMRPSTTVVALKRQREALASQLEYNITFALDSDGFPVSSNPAWNACIRSTLHMVRGRPMRCNRDTYHSGSRWYHPDIPGLEFTWNIHRNLLLDLPQNVEVVSLPELTGNKLLAAAKRTNRKAVANPEILVAMAEIEVPEQKRYRPVLNSVQRSTLVAARPLNLTQKISHRVRKEIAKTVWQVAVNQFWKQLTI